MIEVTPNIRKKYHAAFKKARKEKIRCLRLASDLWYAARVAAGHGRYLVRFDVVPRVGGEEQVWVSCTSINGERCKGTLRRLGMDRDPMCVHQAAHYRIADWEAYLFFRKPDCPESYVLKYEATAGDDFAKQIVTLHTQSRPTA